MKNPEGGKMLLRKRKTSITAMGLTIFEFPRFYLLILIRGRKIDGDKTRGSRQHND